MHGTNLVISGGALICLSLLVGAQAARSFSPPRSAVVDISYIFDEYEKTKDRQAQLQQESKAFEEKLKDLEKKYKELNNDLPNLEPGPGKNEKLIEKLRLELGVKDLRERELKRLEDTKLKYLQEIRDEIVLEITAYAKAQDLDLVLEKAMPAADRQGPGVRLTFVHFVKPELDISAEILARLNSRYRKAP